MAVSVEWGRITELERIERWREAYAIRIGCDLIQAAEVRREKQIDLHLLDDLVRSGCPVDLAIDILT